MLKILKSPGEVKLFLENITEAADSHKDSLGFLPHKAYTQACERKRLWVCTDHSSNAFLGYLYFSESKSGLKVTQLFAAKKGRGVGSTLIASLINYGEKKGLFTLSARVAADLPSNRFWESMGLKKIRTEAGGKTTNRQINLRVLTLSSPSLIPVPADPVQKSENIDFFDTNKEKYLAVLDLNLYLDLAKHRKGYADNAAQLLSLAINSAIHLFVTPELKRELTKHQVPGKSDPLIHMLAALPEANCSPPTKAYLDQLWNEITPKKSKLGKKANNNWADMRHIAYAKHIRADFFITRDGPLIQARDKILSQTGVSTVTPTQFLNNFIPQEQQAWRYEIPLLQKHVPFEISRITQNRHPEIFELSPAPEGLPEEMANLRSSLASPSTNGFIASRSSGSIDGALIWHPKNQALNHQIGILISNSDSGYSSSQLAQTLFELYFLEIENNDYMRLDLFVPAEQTRLHDQLLEYGFHLQETHGQTKWIGFSKLSVAEIVMPDKRHQLTEKIKIQTGLRVNFYNNKKDLTAIVGATITDKAQHEYQLNKTDIELMFSPLHIFDTNSNVAVIPIKEWFSKHLCGLRTIQPDMFDTSSPLGSPEKVYFRSNRGADALRPKDLLFFYTSSPVSEITHYATVTESEVLSTENAVLKHLAHGVLDERQLAEIGSKNAKVHVISFKNVVRLSTPITYDSLKANNLTPANLITLHRFKPENARKLCEMI